MPQELTCPICFDLFEDPIDWPSPQCEQHHFCRMCVHKLCESATTRSVCPICRATSSAPVRDILWSLPVNEVLNARIQAEYPEAYAKSIAAQEERLRRQAELPRVSLPLFESMQRLMTVDAESTLKRGKSVDIFLSTNEQILTLSAVLAKKGPQRFGILLQGQRSGYIAGIVSPNLLPSKKAKTTLEVLSALRFKGKIGHGPLKMKILLVNTFSLEEEILEKPADVQAFFGSSTGVPLRMGTLIAGPLGDIKAYETC